MYNEEIEKRRQFFYPPFSRIIHLSFKHKEREVVTEAAHVFAKLLQPAYGKYIVGPAEPVINRVRSLFLMELLLKLSRDSQFIAKCKEDVLKQIAVLHAQKKFTKVLVIPDMDVV
jgi:primosomal protein N' (replication factor Y)